MRHIYTTGYYLVLEQNESVIYSNMDGPRDYHIKENEPGGEIQISYDIVYMWNLQKERYEWVDVQNGNIPTDMENKLMATKGERDKSGVWDYQTHTTAYKIDKQRGSTV